MTILLAPMEGLLDHPLREVLTAVGGIDRCVTEFIRITDQLLPERVFLRVMPELRNGSRTRAGTPVRAQLLGSDPNCLADNAARLAELGAEGIDLNFGCPAKTVNRHRGGAVLLDEPDLLHDILAAVRRAVPAHLPVSAKMRLGHRDDDNRVEAAQALATGGAGELVVHARTKLQGYRPPAFWHRVADIRAAVRVPVIANGDIVDPEGARAVLAATGADALMIGRGAFGRPWLFREIAHFLATGKVLPAPDAREWSEIVLAHLDDIHAFHGEQAGVRFARKHIGWYVHGMPGGEVLRDQVNQACTIAAQRAAVEAWCAVLQARERRGVAPAPVASRPVYNNHRTSAGRERPRLEEIHR